jgi:hypothetical protein
MQLHERGRNEPVSGMTLWMFDDDDGDYDYDDGDDDDDDVVMVTVMI